MMQKLSFLWRSCISICDRSSDRISDPSGDQGTKYTGWYDSCDPADHSGRNSFRCYTCSGIHFAFPAGIGHQFLKVDFMGALNFAYIPFLIALFVPDFFSTFGTVLGVGAKAGYLDKDGNLPGIDKCFKVDAIATSFGALFGMPSLTTYLESSAGVEAGGKRDLRLFYKHFLRTFAVSGTTGSCDPICGNRSGADLYRHQYAWCYEKY